MVIHINMITEAKDRQNIDKRIEIYVGAFSLMYMKM